MCFCGHIGKHHDKKVTKKKQSTKCNKCPCKEFKFIPRRPEELGQWWLPRRKGFNIREWKPKCKCGLDHTDHDPVTLSGKGGCYTFQSDFCCINCDGMWEDHETVIELEHERMQAGKPIQEDFLPLATSPDIQKETLKHLEVLEKVREMTGCEALTPGEKLVEEQKREEMLKDPQLLQVSAPGAGMEVNLQIGGNSKPMQPRQDLSKPERSIRLMKEKQKKLKKRALGE